MDGTVPGLNDYVAADGTVLHPPVAPVFFAFRIMVGMGVLMLLVSWTGVALMRRRRAGVEGLPKLFLCAAVAMTFAGWITTLAGWYTTEIGRQPWLVTGLLSTEQAVAEVPAPMVLGTLIAYLAVYLALILAYGQIRGFRQSFAFILVGHVVFTLPFMVRTVSAAFARDDLQSLDEAARSLGASFPQRFLGVMQRCPFPLPTLCSERQ
jgi:ABC-type sulfate transport system permease component